MKILDNSNVLRGNYTCPECATVVKADDITDLNLQDDKHLIGDCPVCNKRICWSCGVRV
jgi:endogenous inhibitor of DNA gyrase (YacG/DUF329 family)